MKHRAIYPGTFDPITLGHLDVIRRAATLFDELVVAVAESTRKKTWFSVEDRVALVRSAVRSLRNVDVEPFSGLLIDYVRRRGSRIVVRGLRAFTDFEYEFQMALTNRKLAPDIETVFLMTSESHSYISSTMVREVAELGGETAPLVPAAVNRALKKRLGATRGVPT
ncbi:MAG: pantetheine-phosphate adenylyltransferase [Kiritimatiellae bacterium]|nr:pantetheine-phosphate adenylyltransferase [Kiritimatiellia bacterium]MDW8458312.1 pantetheine-phosphate adenylyltransferase [Verrucomicrobiota bacterium]